MGVATVGDRRLLFSPNSLFVGVVVIYLFLSFLSFNQIEEDTYIYLKTARNIFHGFGYVFNVGESPVETGSSVIWQFLCVPLFLLPLDVVVSVKLMGIFWGGASLFLLWLIGRELIGNRYWALLPCLLVAVNVSYLMHAQTGLDSSIFVFVMLLFAWSCLDESRFRYWPGIALLLLLVRSEGVVLLTLLSPILFIYKKNLRKELIKFSLVVVLFILMEIFRVLYFSDLMPNPFYRKMLGNDVGFSVISTFLKENFVHVLLPFFLAALFFRGAHDKKLTIVLLFSIVCALWGVLSGDKLGFARRMLPALPFSYLIGIYGLNLCTARWSALKNKVLFPIAMAAYVLSILLCVQTFQFFNKPVDNFNRYLLSKFFSAPEAYAGALLQKIRQPHSWTYLDTEIGAFSSVGTNYQSIVGKFVNLNYPKSITVVYDQMGQTPYNAGADKTFIDSWGITDQPLGHYYFWTNPSIGGGLAIYRDYFDTIHRWIFNEPAAFTTVTSALDYIESRKPDLVMINLLVLQWTGTESITAKLLRYVYNNPNYLYAYMLNDSVLFFHRQGLAVDQSKILKGLTISNSMPPEVKELVNKIDI